LESLTKNDTSYKKFTYHPQARNKFQKIFKEFWHLLINLTLKIFKDFNITLAPINKCNIKNLIKANYKDKEPPLKKSGIYKINCKQCEKVYIGQTKINLENILEILG
jgi:hypothetical protein